MIPEGTSMFTGILRRVRSVQKLVQYSSQPKRQKRRWRWKILGTVGVFCGGYYGWKYIKEYTKPTFEGPKKRLIILGSGWGAMSVLKHLDPGQFEVVIVSPRNYFMFTPLLPSVTVGTVEARSIVEPVRKILAKQYAKHPVNFLEAECMSVNPEKKTIHCKDCSGVVGAVESFDLDYDLLVMAVGATTNTFRTPGVEEHAHFLKEIPDARRIRDILIDNVETASIPGQPVEERKRLLHIVVVGGGPTGVEFAAEAADFLREDVSRIYPNVIEDCKVTLIHSRRSVLNTYDKTISDYTQSTMKSDKVNLVTNSRYFMCVCVLPCMRLCVCAHTFIHDTYMPMHMLYVSISAV